MTTNFGRAANPMFEDPPGCLFHHQASFITDFFKNEAGAADGDFDFFVMPDIDPAYTGAITTAGDLFGMFNDTPQAQSLIQYLLTAEAQQIWVERGGFISMNKNVPIEAYPDDTSRRSAELLQAAEYRQVRRLGPDAERHEPGLLRGDRGVRPEPRLTSTPSSTRARHRPGRRLRRLTNVHSTAPAA